MQVRSYRDLRVWQLGMDLVTEIYMFTQAFPKSETYGLASQAQRAAVSIPSNIAEGHTRVHTKEYLNHLSIACGSLSELQTQIEIAERLNYLNTEQTVHFWQKADALGRQLQALRKALTSKSERRSSLTPNP